VRDPVGRGPIAGIASHLYHGPMDYANLHAPWRMEYIRSLGDEESDAGCFLCRYWEQPEHDSENHVIWRTASTLVVMNRFPYTSGHLMTLPYAHVATLEELDVDTRAELMELAVTAMQVLKLVYHPQGFNLGMNIGDAGGAGIAEHVHMHIVPRWIGDTNFMSSLGETRVLPELLDETYRRVCRVWYAGPDR